MKKRFLYFLLGIGSLLVLHFETACAQSQPLDASTLWMFSQLIAAGDGMNATAVCGTWAQDPLATPNSSDWNFVSITANSGYYFGMSTVCNAYDSGGNQVWSSNTPLTYQLGGKTVMTNAPCASNNTTYNQLGAGGGAAFPNNDTNTCNGEFPVTPGMTYNLVSQHYLWLANKPGPLQCIYGQPFGDPFAWYDYTDIDFAYNDPEYTWSNSLLNYGWWSADGGWPTLANQNFIPAVIEGAPSLAHFAKGGISDTPPASIQFSSRRRAVHPDSISTTPISPVA